LFLLYLIISHLNIMEPDTSNLQQMIARVGGKSKIANKIIDLMPPHDTYVEPFVGGGSVYFRKPLVATTVINDKDKDIIDIYRDMRDVGLSTKKMVLAPSRHAFERLLKQKKFKSKRERLYRNLYLSKFSYSGNRKSYWGEKEDKRKAGMRHGEVIKRNAERYIAKFKKTHILNEDFRNVIRKYDSPKTLFYLDPPYSEQDKGWGYDEGGTLTPTDIENALRNIKGKFILSYDNSPLVREAFKNYHIKRIKTIYELSGERQEKTELLISNFKLK
jgi:DNA adenine methylase